MDIFFTDPTDIPLPPDEVHIRDFTVTPYPDGRRLRVYLEISPFQKRPSGEIWIQDSEGNQVASVNIIETIDPKMEITMHLRNPETVGGYTAHVRLFYTAELSEDGPDDEVIQQPEQTQVDQSELTFRIDNS